jgi:biopolymer transport protein ExbD
VERPRGLETLVFLDDQRYVLSDREDERRLRAAVDGMVGRPGGRDLLLLADRRVPHGDVVALVNLVRETGVQRVNVAVKPE